ncbi:unnamed protein product [Urochloa decumbens]|uniref:Pectinesterase inhibitor domain-containing protein n=1 Tax=Urochloa decumbens TaxID=240449 RepID=A0ABC9FHI9_9POAL
MAPHPRALSTHHLVLLLTVAAVTTQAATTDAAAPAPTPRAAESRSSTGSSFLRARCATTQYQTLCYDSLLPYASEFQTSHARLARAAADVAAAHLRALSTRVKGILHRHGSEPAVGSGGGRPSEAAALRDCTSTTSAAANLVRQSSAELDRLDAAPTAAASGSGGRSSREARWEVSNAKTWLSAAMTDEGTCSDGLEEAGATASPAGKEVTAGVVSVKQYTSNALALVNGIPL